MTFIACGLKEGDRDRTGSEGAGAVGIVEDHCPSDDGPSEETTDGSGDCIEKSGFRTAPQSDPSAERDQCLQPSVPIEPPPSPGLQASSACNDLAASYRGAVQSLNPVRTVQDLPA